jgi:hypothetical protein
MCGTLGFSFIQICLPESIESSRSAAGGALKVQRGEAKTVWLKGLPAKMLVAVQNPRASCQ